MITMRLHPDYFIWHSRIISKARAIANQESEPPSINPWNDLSGGYILRPTYHDWLVERGCPDYQLDVDLRHVMSVRWYISLPADIAVLFKLTWGTGHV